ncbi:hypothetical protein [Phenylobacterium sp.]|uniref:hypothetical protein n=1 Tax=Phenylobacterium sp. TaxID=1871053 RepID=UPI002F42885F
MTGFRARASLAAGLLLVAGAVHAEPQAKGRVPVLQGLLDCRKVAADAARLACYDAAAGAMDQAEAKGDVVVVDREQARTVRHQGFGFNLPSLAIFDRGETPEDIRRVALKVLAASRDGNGKWTVTVEGGQVWRQIDTGDFTVTPREGMTANIRQAMMGSYIMSIGGHAGVRVHRDR